MNLKKKYDALGNAYQKLLSRMVKSGGIFQEFWQWVYGASEFTPLVRKKFYNDLEAYSNGVDQKIFKPIDDYLERYENNTDKLHIQKRAVMGAIKNYIVDPTEKNWEALKQARKKHPLWNQGLFSKVRFFMAEVEEAHNIKEEARTEKTNAPYS